MSAITSTTLKRTVTAAGTAVQLQTSSVLCVGAIIQALDSNTTSVYVGNASSDVTNHSGASPGIALAAGESITLANIQAVHGGQLNWDLSTLYLDADTNGEGVAILYFTNSRQGVA